MLKHLHQLELNKENFNIEKKTREICELRNLKFQADKELLIKKMNEEDVIRSQVLKQQIELQKKYQSELHDIKLAQQMKHDQLVTEMMEKKNVADLQLKRFKRHLQADLLIDSEQMLSLNRQKIQKLIKQDEITRQKIVQQEIEYRQLQEKNRQKFLIQQKINYSSRIL